MDCQQAKRLIEAHFDGELDLMRRIEMEEHLSQCPGCAAADKELSRLRESLAAPSLYHRAPASLRSRIQAAYPAAPSSRRRSYLQMTAVAAGLLLAFGATAWLGYWSTATRSDRLADWVVAAHIRSLQVDHLTDVASTDQHTVKPWFLGKLDFAPPVVDLAGEGYPLSGGRLDYLADRAVATLVYHRRMHAINLFIWPAEGEATGAAQNGSRHGFNFFGWQQNGINYWAVSDLGRSELETFVRLVQERPAAGAP